jgi:hypothetical protein
LVIAVAEQLYLRLRGNYKLQRWRFWDGKRWFRVEGMEGAPGTPGKRGVRDRLLVFEGWLEVAVYRLETPAE